MKCVLITRDKFIKHIERDKAERWFTMNRMVTPELFDALSISDPTKLFSDRVEFLLDRIYKNEYEEEVAIYYEQ